MRLALSNTAENTTMALGPFLLGAIAATAGYGVVFGLSMALEAIALVVIVWMVEEPRKRRLNEPAVPSLVAIGESEDELEAELEMETSGSARALDPER
jgi:uncharacterized membrane protein YhiD involved in acid resistance